MSVSGADARAGGAVRRRLSLWLPVAAWLVVIAVMSTGAASRSSTEGSLLEVLAAWWPGLAAALEGASWWGAAGWAARKAAHLVEYGVLASLVLRALRGEATLRRAAAPLRGWAAEAAAFVSAVAVAAGDELHQATVASRSGSAVDVGIDALGAFLAVAVAVFRSRRSADRVSGRVRKMP